MASKTGPQTNPSRLAIYQIRIQGHLGHQWTDWFDGLVISLEENGDTLLTGPVVDQAALYGLLRKVRDLGMPLLSVNCVCTSEEDRSNKEDDMSGNEQTMDTLVTTEWLSQHLDEPDLVVLDCTVTVKPDPVDGFRILSGRAEYDNGHIPGAGFADLLGDLSDRNSSYWVAMPTPAQFCAAIGTLGVGDDSRVVLYDNNQSMWAARVWWMLRWVGFDRAALLDGGLKLWTAEERPLSTELPTRPTKQLTPNVRPKLIANRDEVFAAIDNNAVCLIDTLGADSYRAQHIPSAANLDATMLVDESGRYRPLDELTAMHDTLNVGDRNARTITYCGGGVAASSNAFAMIRLGFTNVAVYAASMQEWAADPANPLVVAEA